jgi:hypothetical protein
MYKYLFKLNSLQYIVLQNLNTFLTFSVDVDEKFLNSTDVYCIIGLYMNAAECANMAANLAFKLVTYLIILNFSNQFLAFRLFTSIVESNIYKDSYRLNVDGSFSIYEWTFFSQHVNIHRTKYDSKFKVPFTVNKPTKHGSICLALPSKSFKVDLTICVDVSPNPGPETSKRNNFGTENLITVGASSRSAAITKIVYKPSKIRRLERVHIRLIWR